jgi:hypothetical protein
MYSVHVRKNDIDPLLQLPIKRTVIQCNYESLEEAVKRADEEFENGTGEYVSVTRRRTDRKSPDSIYMRVWFAEGEAN